ncbi:MAG: alpha/beta hydrolase fold domain-containing protein [Succinivibrio sp.]|nr:alpha/beta hydrolase fold domain-containing protein [Succinivibrio sp.]
MKVLRSLYLAALTGTLALGGSAQALVFDPATGVKGTLQLPDGRSVSYTGYEKIFYVEQVEDPAYQYLNIYVPEGAGPKAPIFLRTYVGGYMASAAAAPQATDASGRALAEGFVVAIPGTRGRNSVIKADENYAQAHPGVSVGDEIYTGRAPAAILDLKAAVRYLRHFASKIPADANHIITDGTSAGGAMSALLGATGNRPEYEPYLKAMGAAAEKDDVFASVCFCPITDLEHADMAYEWLYSGTSSRQSLDEQHRAYSQELAALYPQYLNSLKLKTPDGKVLNADNYLDFLKAQLIRAAQLAKDAGAEIPQDIGFSFSSSARGGFAAPVDGKAPTGEPGAGPDKSKDGLPPRGSPQLGEYITALDLAPYLDYVVSTQPLKTVPAFDSLIAGVNEPSGENGEFGDASGSNVNFTAFSAGKNDSEVSAEVKTNLSLLNPLHFVDDKKTAVAPHWYIRHGARDRDTAFTVPLNLYLKLKERGEDVNFLLAWNRPHSGDYSLNELFSWLKEILKQPAGKAKK